MCLSVSSILQSYPSFVVVERRWMCLYLLCVCLFVCSVPQRCPIFWWSMSYQDDLPFGRMCSCALCFTLAFVCVCQCRVYCKTIHFLLLWRGDECVCIFCVFFARVQRTTKMSHLLVVHVLSRWPIVRQDVHTCLVFYVSKCVCVCQYQSYCKAIHLLLLYM